jgi:hypothetical protein
MALAKPLLEGLLYGLSVVNSFPGLKSVPLGLFFFDEIVWLASLGLKLFDYDYGWSSDRTTEL